MEHNIDKEKINTEKLDRTLWLHLGESLQQGTVLGKKDIDIKINNGKIEDEIYNHYRLKNLSIPSYSYNVILI